MKAAKIPFAHTTVISNTNAIFSNGINGRFIIPNWKLNGADDIYNGDGGYSSSYDSTRQSHGDDSDSGTAPISPECLFIDTDCTGGDLIISAGWGNGFAIRRLGANGTPYLLYADDQFNETTYRSTINHFSSMAVDTENKKVYLGSTWTSDVGLIVIDYSPFENSDTWTNLTTTFHCNGTVNGTSTTSGWQADMVGSHYFNAFALAGNWLYFTQHSTYHGEAQSAQRFNVNTYEYEQVTEVNQTAGYQRRGHVWYDAPRDRIHLQSFYGNSYHVVTNASSDDNAESVNIGQYSENRGSGFILDDDDPDIVYNLTNSRIRKIDISDALAKTGADGEQLAEYYADGALSIGYQKIAAPTGSSKFIQVIADRAWHRNNSYFDEDNDRVIGLLRDTTNASVGSAVLSDYGNWVRRVKANNGTYYDLWLAYGYHGHKFWIWNDGEGTGFEETAEVVCGTFSLTDNSNVTEMMIPADVITKTGTACSLEVSNNNGSTYESYTPNSLHTFSSTGNSVKIKITFSNPNDAAAYVWGISDVILFQMGKVRRNIYKTFKAFKSSRNWIRRN